jgi:hypothetical protein
MIEKSHTRNRQFNRVGIPVYGTKTVSVPASIWAGDFTFIKTTTLVKYIAR